MSVLRLHAQAIWSHTCLLCPLSLARSLPPFLSISACDCSTTEGRGRVFTKKEVRPIGGQEHLCAVSQKHWQCCMRAEATSFSFFPLSLSLFLLPSKVLAWVQFFSLFLACSFALFVPLYCIGVFPLLRDSMHFWLIPTFAGLAERAGRQSCQFGHMTCYSQGLPEQEEEERREEERRRGGGGDRGGNAQQHFLWASLFLLLQRAILSKRPLYWTGEIGGRVTKGRMLIACRHGENVKIKCALCL